MIDRKRERKLNGEQGEKQEYSQAIGEALTRDAPAPFLISPKALTAIRTLSSWSSSALAALWVGKDGMGVAVLD